MSDQLIDAIAEAVAARLRPQPRGGFAGPEHVLELAETAAARVEREGSRGATSISTDQITAMAAVIIATGATGILRQMLAEDRARATENPDAGEPA